MNICLLTSGNDPGRTILTVKPRSSLLHQPGRAWSRPLWRFSAAKSMCCGTLRTISRSVTSSDINMSVLWMSVAVPMAPLMIGSRPPVDTEQRMNLKIPPMKNDGSICRYDHRQVFLLFTLIIYCRTKQSSSCFVFKTKNNHSGCQAREH